MLTGASTTGKTTIAKQIEQAGIKRIAGDTTRKPRAGEVAGVDFNFITKQEFASNFSNGHYLDPNLEVTKYNGENYGSPKLWLPQNNMGGGVSYLHLHQQ